MSIWNSNMLCEEEIDELTSMSVFDVPEIECLYERFKYLDRSSSGHLSFAEFHMIPEFYSNPFSKLIMEYLERQLNYERLTFGCFISFLEIFSSKTSKCRRIAFLFELFDLDEEGKLSRDVLRKMYWMMTRCEDERKIQDVLDMYDQGCKGYLDLEDFSRMYNQDQSLEENMIIDFSRNIENVRDESIWNMIWPSNASKH